MQRTTRKQLETQCHNLNKLLGTPTESWTAGKANIGNIYLDHNIGGWAIYQIVDDRSSVTCPMGDYRLTPWECWHALRAACGAVQLAQERAKLQEPIVWESIA